jgi:eukaryotic-like serine/threonine-protein kinase
MHPSDPRVALLRDRLVGTILRGTDGIRFHLRELIGEGGQGWIFRGNYDEPDGMHIVVKLLRPDSVTEDTLRRFQREAEVLRRLGGQANPNPNLVRFYDHGVARLTPPNASPNEWVDLPFTVLEYVRGSTLSHLIRGEGGKGMEPQRTRRLLRQVSGALSFIHAQNIVHRDLKPSNILVADDHGLEIAKVTDFGLAKLVDFTLQRTMMLAGASLGYAPPEQYEKGNDRVSARTDVFSMAAIMFECLTGNMAFPVFMGETPTMVFQRLMTAPRPSLAANATLLHAVLAERHNLVTMLDAEIARATQADPAKRHGSIREFWEAVEPALRGAAEPSVVPHPSPLIQTPPLAPPARGGSGRPSAPPVETMAFRILSELPRKERLRTGVIAQDGKEAFALGSLGVYRWSAGSAWSQVPISIEAERLRGLAIMQGAGLLCFGDRGLVVAVSPAGATQHWALADQDLDLHGALVDRVGIVLVGQRRSSPAAVAVDATYGRPPAVRTVEIGHRLRSVARLSQGGVLACGEDGALARIDTQTAAAIPWGRTGHLLSIAARADGGAHAVGSGGHALSISPSLQANLEAVQTTRDLLHVAVAPDGTAWASATDQRILRREGKTWVRIPLGLELDEKLSILTLMPSVDTVIALTHDGRILEGRLMQ